MKPKRSWLLLALALTWSLLPCLESQELDGSDVQREVNEREERVSKLSTGEQLQLRAAQKKAAEDPEVLAALKKRNEAIAQFRAALRSSMIKADPAVAPILEKVAILNAGAAERAEQPQ